MGDKEQIVKDHSDTLVLPEAACLRCHQGTMVRLTDAGKEA